MKKFLSFCGCLLGICTSSYSMNQPSVELLNTDYESFYAKPQERTSPIKLNSAGDLSQLVLLDGRERTIIIRGNHVCCPCDITRLIRIRNTCSTHLINLDFYYNLFDLLKMSKNETEWGKFLSMIAPEDAEVILEWLYVIHKSHSVAAMNAQNNGMYDTSGRDFGFQSVHFEYDRDLEDVINGQVVDLYRYGVAPLLNPGCEYMYFALPARLFCFYHPRPYNILKFKHSLLNYYHDIPLTTPEETRRFIANYENRRALLFMVNSFRSLEDDSPEERRRDKAAREILLQFLKATKDPTEPDAGLTQTMDHNATLDYTIKKLDLPQYEDIVFIYDDRINIQNPTAAPLTPVPVQIDGETVNVVARPVCYEDDFDRRPHLLVICQNDFCSNVQDRFKAFIQKEEQKQREREQQGE